MKHIAIVTGASSGLGAEFARQLLEGFPVCPQAALDEIWLVARRRDRLESLAAAHAGAARSPIAVAIESDLSLPEACRRLADRVKLEGATVGLLVNNAGYGTYGPFAETELEFQLGQIDLNCRSLTALCGLILPHMQAGSKIINVASLAAFSALGNFAVYAASKAYVLNFSAGLRAELASRRIGVTAVCPGSVSTEFAAVASGGARREVLHGHPAAAVVRSALRHARRGKFLSLHALDWKLSAFASRLAGRLLIARLTWRFNRRPQARTIR